MSVFHAFRDLVETEDPRTVTDDATGTALAEWRDTWFGSPDRWSPALRAAARECLTSPVPATLAWGPDFRLLYNQGYAALLEDQHPAVRGRPAWEPAAAMWPVVGPMLHHVRTTGEPQHGERTALARDTPGGRSTRWYSWTYTAVWAGNRVEGVFAVVHDVTADELAARHDEARSAAADVVTADDLVAALRELVRAIATMPDVRFATCHLLDPHGSWTRLADGGSELQRPTAASLLEHAEAIGRWPVASASREVPLPAVVRSPGGDRRGLWDSWTAVTAVRSEIVALTIGFAPLVGDAREHRTFVTALARVVSSGRP